MEGPGYDIDCMSGLIAGGTNIILFSTGLGTPTGAPIAPVIKITANHETYTKMKPNIDIYLPIEDIIEKNKPLETLARDYILPKVIEIVNGVPAKAEKWHQFDFSIRQLWIKS